MSYRVAVVGGDLDDRGMSEHGDIGLSRLVDAGLTWRAVGEHAPDDSLVDADALCVMGGRRVDHALLRGAPRIRHVARFGAGYDAVDVPACTASGVVLTTTPGAVRRPMALAALTLVLAVTHNLVQKHRLTISGEWGTRRIWRGEHTDGSRIAVVGLGGVGLELARMLIALGFDVLGVNRRGSHAQAESFGVVMTDLDSALGADVVVLAAALTDQTRGMIGASQLSRMRPDAALVNIGRGGLVDESALVSALREGRLRAAGLDVFEREPLAAEDPLLSLPNVTLTPHALGWTASFAEAVSAAVVQSILEVARGERPASVVNPEAFLHPRWA